MRQICVAVKGGQSKRLENYRFIKIFIRIAKVFDGISDNRIKANDNLVKKEVGRTGPVKKC